MLEIEVNGKKNNYKFKCTSEERIIQNIVNIVSRIKGNIPLNREKGIDSNIIDEDVSFVKASLTALLMDEIEREEPRFDVREINFGEEEIFNGKINVVVKGVILSE
ncbi:MAG: hypothetical protein ACRCU6_00115 [Fusobacteriaceae bacterium]